MIPNNALGTQTILLVVPAFEVVNISRTSS